jgi:hypothetical protein
MPAELPTTKVIIHPLVLLSVVDHFTRMSKIGSQKRVVGVLLGCWKAKGILDVSNSFAGNFKAQFIIYNTIINIFYHQFLSTKTKRIRVCGSWITTIWNQCTECLRK